MNTMIILEKVGIKLIRIKEIDWVNDNINTKKFIKQTINSEIIKC